MVSDYAEGVVKLLVGGEARAVVTGHSNPYWMAVDKEGNILVADSGNESPKVFSPEYTMLREFKPGFRPLDVAIQSSGRLVVIGYAGQMALLDLVTGADIRCLGCSGYVTTVGVAVDSEDRIYMTQHHGKKVVFTHDSQSLGTIGSIASLPVLDSAWGIKAVGGGKGVALYIAELGRVRLFPVEFELWAQFKQGRV